MVFMLLNRKYGLMRACNSAHAPAPASPRSCAIDPAHRSNETESMTTKPIATFRSTNGQKVCGNSGSIPASYAVLDRPNRKVTMETTAMRVIIAISTAVELRGALRSASFGLIQQSSAAPARPIQSRKAEVRARSFQKSMPGSLRASVTSSAVSSTISTIASVTRDVQKSGR